MTAKKNRRVQTPLDLNGALTLHLERTRRLERLVEESRVKLRDGNIRAAKRLYQEATTIQEQLRAIEREFRPKRPEDLAAN